MTRRTGELRIGEPKTATTAPAHTPGVREGNEEHGYERQGGHLADGRSTAERSTGINPRARNPIDPSSPNLSPP
ncbi:MAG: hypothetical protein IRZ00_20920 [Gemmatimonadetes bacterium]|nr:hypothetical protein [Gemmatimonadota bacterium]